MIRTTPMTLTNTSSPENSAECRAPIATELAPIDLGRRNMNFELGDFYISRRFRSFIQNIIIPDGLIQSRLERMAESILRDFNAENQEISIVVTQENSLKFYRDLQKKLTQRSLSTQFKAYHIKETYVRTAPDVMERVWKIVLIKSGNGEQVTSPIEVIQGKNVLLLTSIINSGNSVEQLSKSMAQFGPKNMKIAVAF